MAERPSIIIAEDDSIQSEAMVQAIKTLIPQAKVDVIETESGFRRKFPELAGNPPDLVILDIMMRWCNPSEDAPEHPDDVKLEGFYQAGFRLQRILAQNPATESIPVLIFTVLTTEDVKSVRSASDTLEGTYFLSKINNAELFVNEVKAILNGETPSHAVRLEKVS